MEDEQLKKKCSICNFSTNTSGEDTVLFGKWLECNNIQVHYFCLLLSTNLPQKGIDCSGLLGFLLSDIRAEIKAAAKRICFYCGRNNASIGCHKCGNYFHLICGDREKCLFQFEEDFHSYCHKCLPLTAFQNQCIKQNLDHRTCCYICYQAMGDFHPVSWIYGSCCNKGFAHRFCMLKYASESGYYLRCIWCRSEEFRRAICLQGIFVPDRDATWERQRGAFNDLHRGHKRCDISKCLCPRGRDYVTSI